MIATSSIYILHEGEIFTYSISFDNTQTTLQGLTVGQEQSQTRTAHLTPSQALFWVSILPL
jgi:hypothetical protein